MLHDVIRTEEDVEKFAPVMPWDHQIRGVYGVTQKLKSMDAVTLTSPTGGGKSVQFATLMIAGVHSGSTFLLLTNRRLLTEQTIRNLEKAGISFGVRAASYEERHDPNQPVQLSSIQTEVVRVMNRKTMKMPKVDYAIIDESHLCANGSSEAYLRALMDNGTKLIGVTATPIEVSHLYPSLVVAGTNSELRRCGAHIPVYCKAPFEYDLSKVSRVVTGEYNLDDLRKKVWSQAVVGKVIDEWEKANPNHRMTILFAPGVEEATEMAVDFHARGIRAASIDSKNVWLDGQQYSDPSGVLRNKILEEWDNGDIKVLCNRFVLREAFDAPKIYHGVLAAPIGSLKTFIQQCGRILRYSPETPDHVILTDHAGSVYKFGSPNEDRNWEELYWMTDKEICEKREMEMRKSPEKDPITCPHCGLIRKQGPTCPPPPVGCGQTTDRRRRKIIQRDGTLKDAFGPIVKETREFKSKDISEDQRRWDSLLWAIKNSKSERPSSYAQARGMFMRKHGYWPSGLANCPAKDSPDWKKKVKEHFIVGRDRDE